jgi:phosphohistidine phosphatase
MKQLHLLRHAKTNQISPTGRDFDRELLPKGLEQINDLNRYFSKHSFRQKTDCWVSAAKRTRQTFDGTKNILTIESPIFSDDLYLVSHIELLAKIWETTTENDLLIVGHNFGISDLASYFTEQDIELATGEYIQLTFDCSSWKETSRGMATVSARFRPLKDSLR